MRAPCRELPRASAQSSQGLDRPNLSGRCPIRTSRRAAPHPPYPRFTAQRATSPRVHLRVNAYSIDRYMFHNPPFEARFTLKTAPKIPQNRPFCPVFRRFLRENRPVLRRILAISIQIQPESGSGSGFQLGHLFRAQLQAGCGHVLFQMRHLRRARNGQHHRRALQQPSQRKLCDGG